MMRERTLRGACLLVGVWAILLASAGCVQRTISVSSEPVGSLVYLNDQEVGRTPLAVPFTHYGVYDVRLEHEGYQPLWTQARADAPWWDLPGPDLIAEMIPGGRSSIRWHFQLSPQVPVDADALLQRAGELREMTR